MCFSISYALSKEGLEERFNANFEAPEIYQPAYHASAFNLPKVPIINSEKKDTIQLLTWGLIPFWVKDKKTADQLRTKTFNARAETVFEKPSFRSSIVDKRCLILVDGFFEWQHVEGKKYPYFIQLSNHNPFAIAGIWDEWKNKENDNKIQTFSLITTKANPLLEKIHNSKKRMPVILKPEDEIKWFDKRLTKDEIDSLMVPYDENEMEAYTVSKLVSMRWKNSNVPGARERFEYEELKMQQKKLF
jgi:putative SOS response-associated peptidase YedK